MLWGLAGIRRSSIPKGLHHSARGCAPCATPGNRPEKHPNPNGVASPASPWKKDVTRHSAATYMLATSGSAAAVATTLGNSETILKRHYLALVTRAQAEAFWAVQPTAVPATDSPSASSARTSP